MNRAAAVTTRACERMSSRDGVSLTVSAKTPTGAEVSLIPETLRATTLGEIQPGALLNVEVDVIGKYVESLLGGYR